MYVLAGMLVIGLACNFFIRPVAEHHYMSSEQLATERARAHEPERACSAEAADSRRLLRVAACAAVALPLWCRVCVTITRSLALFR